MKSSLFLSVVLALTSTGSSGQKLVIKGSDTPDARLVPTLKETYVASHPGISFEIAAEGSTAGLAAIIAQIGLSSRRAKPTEMSAATAKGVTLKPVIVASDGMAVVVNSNNPLAKMILRQVKQIFTGDVTDWSAVRGKPGGISIYPRSTASGTYSDWKDLAMRKRDYDPSSQKTAISCSRGRWRCRITSS